jgi:SAM-dependent methyltransferase
MSVPRVIQQPVLRTLRPLLGGVELNHLARLLPVAALLRDARPRTVLDVGSGSRGLARWLPRELDVTAVDASFDDYGAARRFSGRRARAVVGDVLELPFPDGSFDAVAAVDLLEHVAPADRDRALDELVRVTRRRLVVACPTGSAALAADRALAEGLSADGRTPPGWIVEHLGNGFPEANEIAARLAPHGDVHTTPNLSIGAHVRLIRAEVSVAAYVPTRLAAAGLGLAFRAGGDAARAAEHALAVVRGHDRPPTYRTILRLDRTG